LWSFLGITGNKMLMATNPMVISTATPKKGPRQLIPPSRRDPGPERCLWRTERYWLWSID
jgi:hypothetical protein